MFICTKCKQEKPDSDEGSVGRLAWVGVHFISKPFSEPYRLCRSCALQHSVAGIFVSVAVAAFVVFLAAAIVVLLFRL